MKIPDNIPVTNESSDEQINDKIIPTPLYQICHIYYDTHEQTTIFIKDMHIIHSITTTTLQNEPIISKSNHFILEISNRDLKTANYPMAYIPSLYLKNKFNGHKGIAIDNDKDYHVLFSMVSSEEDEVTNTYSPCFMLYEEESNLEKARIKSQKREYLNYDSFKYLDDYHGILATRKHRLFQLKIILICIIVVVWRLKC